MSFLFGTALTEHINKATSDMLLGPSWQDNLDIVEEINQQQDGGKKGVNHLRKRMFNKNTKVQMLTLTLADTIARNCNNQVLGFFASKEFMRDITKLAMPKVASLVDTRVQEKAIELIQTWALGFQHFISVYPLFNSTYEDLRRLGTRFPQPPQNLQSGGEVVPTAAIGQLGFTETPILGSGLYGQRHMPMSARAPRHPPTGRRPTASEEMAAEAADEEMLRQALEMSRREAEQASQDRAPQNATIDESVFTLFVPTDPASTHLESLKVVSSNLEVLEEMFAFCDPATEDITENDLIVSMVATIKVMQERLQEILPTIIDEALMSESLFINDRILKNMAEYDAICEKCKANPEPSAPPRSQPGSSTSEDLISLAYPTSQPAAVSQYPPQPSQAMPAYPDLSSPPPSQSMPPPPAYTQSPPRIAPPPGTIVPPPAQYRNVAPPPTGTIVPPPAQYRNVAPPPTGGAPLIDLMDGPPPASSGPPLVPSASPSQLYPQANQPSVALMSNNVGGMAMAPPPANSLPPVQLRRGDMTAAQKPLPPTQQQQPAERDPFDEFDLLARA